MLIPSSPVLLTQKISQSFGLRMVMANLGLFFWKVIKEKLAQRQDAQSS